MKMLLLARGDLTDKDTSQQAIAQLDKSTYTQSASQFFEGMMSKGILLLNASLVYSEGKVPYHARHWKPFMQSLLEQLALIKPTVQLILLGKMAGIIPPNNLPVGLMAEHPYNISFINNPNVLQFFQPLDLLAHD
jgi:uracil-DNA glycosylase